MTLSELFKKVLLIELLQGLKLTFKQMFIPAVTRQYPDEKRDPFPGSRGLHALVRNPATGQEKCVGCGLCAAMCPSQCIYIYTSEGDDHKKVVDRYEVEVLRCIFCGLCVEACPYGALALTDRFDYSNYRREDFYYTKEMLLENWDKYMPGEKGVDYLERFWGPKAEDFPVPTVEPEEEGEVAK
jgi:NADH-quinone oxidoreductase subunit I